LIKKDFKMSLANYILNKLIKQMRDKERG